MHWKRWLYGLLVATVTGFATGFLVVMTDPVSFDWAQWHRPLSVGALSALFNFMAYIKHPPTSPWDGQDRRSGGRP